MAPQSSLQGLPGASPPADAPKSVFVCPSHPDPAFARRFCTIWGLLVITAHKNKSHAAFAVLRFSLTLPCLPASLAPSASLSIFDYCVSLTLTPRSARRRGHIVSAVTSLPWNTIPSTKKSVLFWEREKITNKVAIVERTDRVSYLFILETISCRQWPRLTTPLKATWTCTTRWVVFKMNKLVSWGCASGLQINPHLKPCRLLPN